MSVGTNLQVLLFDGECAFCNRWVRWLLTHERRARYRFAPLQSRAAAELLIAHGADPLDPSTLIVIDAGLVYRKSDAVIHLLKEMRWPWRLGVALRAVPRRWRNRGYDFVGAHRYAWWGRANSCVLAEPAWRLRALESSLPLHFHSGQCTP